MHEKLRELRNKKGYSCAKMAKMLNISKTFYWQLECRKRTLSYKMACKIAKIFKLKPDAIFYEYYKNCD